MISYGNIINFEYSVLSSMLFHIEGNSEYVGDVILNEKIFSNWFTKEVASILKEHIAKNEYIDSFTLEVILKERNKYNSKMFSDMLACAPLTKQGILFYLQYIHKYKIIKEHIGE